MQKYILIGLSVLLVAFGCGRAKSDINHLVPRYQPIPKNLTEALTNLNDSWNAAKKNDFKNKPEIDAVAELHFSTGLWIRNNWVRGHRSDSLYQYFKKLGLQSPDDISDVILSSFHRKLNNRPIELQKQVAIYVGYQKTIEECEKKTRQLAASNYLKYKIGDAIKIYLDVDTTGGNRNATTTVCPNAAWAFNPQKDLLIDGMVVGKYTYGSDSNGFVKVKITKMNFTNVPVLMQNVKVGEVTDFSLQNLTVK